MFGHDEPEKGTMTMTTAIERLRAALVDGEWTAEDRRAERLPPDVRARAVAWLAGGPFTVPKD